MPGEPPDKDLGYSELVELYGYDEERGPFELVLVKGTMIELPFQSEFGEHTWASTVSQPHSHAGVYPQTTIHTNDLF